MRECVDIRFVRQPLDLNQHFRTFSSPQRYNIGILWNSEPDWPKHCENNRLIWLRIARQLLGSTPHSHTLILRGAICLSESHRAIKICDVISALFRMRSCQCFTRWQNNIVRFTVISLFLSCSWLSCSVLLATVWYGDKYSRSPVHVNSTC